VAGRQRRKFVYAPVVVGTVADQDRTNAAVERIALTAP